MKLRENWSEVYVHYTSTHTDATLGRGVVVQAECEVADPKYVYWKLKVLCSKDGPHPVFIYAMVTFLKKTQQPLVPFTGAYTIHHLDIPRLFEYPNLESENDASGIKQTFHYNRLTEEQAERLAWLAEECNEVAKACMKILRHGYENGEHNNRQALEAEIADLDIAQAQMFASGDIDASRVVQAKVAQFAAKNPACFHHHKIKEDDEAKAQY